MKLSDYIKGLQSILREHGDIDCYYAIDDEGNGFNKVHSNGTVAYRDTDSNPYDPLEDYEIKYDEDFEEADNEIYKPDFIKICIIN